MTPTQWVLLWSDSTVGTLARIIVTIIVSEIYPITAVAAAWRDTSIAQTSIYGWC